MLMRVLHILPWGRVEPKLEFAYDSVERMSERPRLLLAAYLAIFSKSQLCGQVESASYPIRLMCGCYRRIA
jgi:hypothetical protein